jgi:hypothetical protein
MTDVINIPGSDNTVGLRGVMRHRRLVTSSP